MHDNVQTLPHRDPLHLDALASGARTWGALSLVLGTLGLVVVAPALAIWADHTPAQSLVAVAAFASIGVLAGMGYVKAGRELRAARSSTTQAPDLTVRGLDALGRAFRLEAIVTGMSISIAFAVGLVVGAMRNL